MEWRNQRPYELMDSLLYFLVPKEWGGDTNLSNLIFHKCFFAHNWIEMIQMGRKISRLNGYMVSIGKGGDVYAETDTESGTNPFQSGICL